MKQELDDQIQECPFESRRVRYNPPNHIAAMCCQVYDDLKLVNALANVRQMDAAIKQIEIIKMRLDYCIKKTLPA